MAVRIEDAGFEIRDMIAWVYGSGFPKSLDVSKAIDKAAGAEREVVGQKKVPDIKGDAYGTMNEKQAGSYDTISIPITAPATPEAKQWEGWGTALKPALEPITVARKPLIGTVAENVLQHGTGAINVDGGRVGTEQRYNPPAGNKAGGNSLNMSAVGMPEDADGSTAAGRWPANFIHDGSEEATDLLGASARFFYCAKASKADRDEGCEGLEAKQVFGDEGGTYQGLSNSNKPSRNHHPTVKPTDLMRYLCRLVTPPSGIVLDPFMGSGSTGKAAMLEGFAFVGIEREAEYIDIAKARIQSAVGLL
jgi:site-specific DNA-methyltransferase (adenine-specific)